MKLVNNLRDWTCVTEVETAGAGELAAMGCFYVGESLEKLPDLTWSFH